MAKSKKKVRARSNLSFNLMKQRFSQLEKSYTDMHLFLAGVIEEVTGQLRMLQRIQAGMIQVTEKRAGFDGFNTELTDYVKARLEQERTQLEQAVAKEAADKESLDKAIAETQPN